MRLDGTRILVTGGGGFVGVPSVQALLAQGAEVRVLDSGASSRLKGIRAEVLAGDISDAETVERACEGVDAVLHLAVLPLSDANVDHGLAFQTNVCGSFNVFRAAGTQGVGRVVYASASSAYGPSAAVPIQEDHPLRPNAFYPASKAAAEMLLRGLAGSYGYTFAILRYMNVYGPGQRSGVVPAVVRKLRAGARPQINGDGTQAFDFVYVGDCVRANVLALSSDVSGEDFNVGNGTATSLNDLVAILADLTDQPVAPSYQGTAAASPPRVGDVAKARELLTFSVATSLRDGLRSVLNEP